MSNKQFDFGEYSKKTKDHFADILTHINEIKKEFDDDKKKLNPNNDSCLFSKFSNIFSIGPSLPAAPTNREVAYDFYERLLFRYAILSRMEILEHQYKLHEEKANNGNELSQYRLMTRGVRNKNILIIVLKM